MGTHQGAQPWDSSARVADRLPVGVLVIDPVGDARYANAAWAKLTSIGEPGSAKRWLDVFPVEERQDRFQEILTSVAEASPYHADWTFRAPAGPDATLQVVGVPEIIEGRVAAFVLTAADVTADRAALAALVLEVAHDQLTGLYNRNGFATFVQHALDRRRRDTALQLAVIVVDVDDLKATNDTFGHDAGDQLLTEIAGRVAAAVRPGDVVARHGGDEFAVLCEGLHDEAEAEAIADRVRAAVVSSHGASGPFSASVGVASANGHIEFGELIADADQAMYRAKRQRSRAPSARLGALENPVDQLAMAAHELRGPITAIAGHAAILRQLSDGHGNDDSVVSIAAIERQAQRLNRTIQDLLQLSTIDHEGGGPLTPCDITGVIALALEIAPPPVGVSVTTETVRDDPLRIVSDEHRLVGVLSNLLTNAYRHGGPAVTIRARRDHDDAVIEVEDDGPGVALADRPHIFEPFARGGARRDDQAQQRGNGLGLAIAKHAAESLRGRLYYRDIEPHGARFSLRIPMKHPEVGTDADDFA